MSASSSSSSSAVDGSLDPHVEVARLLAENEELKRRGNALLHDHSLLQAQVAHQQQAAPSPAPFVIAGPIVPPMRYRAPEPKIPSPHSFTGEVGPAIDDWLLIVNRYMQFMPEGFSTEARKMAWAEMYLSTSVTSWLNTARAERSFEGRAVDTWEKLEALMRERFQPLEAAVFARHRLDKMTQGSSVSAYNDYFHKNIQFVPRMDVGDRIHHYVKGLKDVVRVEVVRRAPKSIHEAMQYAIGAEAWTKQSFASSSHGSSRFSRGGPHHGPSSGSSNMDLSNVNHSTDQLEEDRDAPPQSPSREGGQLLAMEQKIEKLFALLNHASGSGRGDRRQDTRGPSGGSGRVPGVSRDEYNKCRDKNVCLKCKESGHVAKDCTKAYKPMPSNW